MKIVHFLSCTGHGGDALAALALARGQQALGHEVEIAIGASSHSALFVERSQKEDVAAREVADLPLLDNISKTRRIASFRACIGRLAPDIVHLHTGGLAVRTADVVGARLVPAAARVATIQWPFDWQPGSQTEQRQWRRISRLLDRVICPSSVSSRQQIAAGLPARKVATLPNAVDIGQVAAGDREGPRKEFGIGPDQMLVLFLARIEAQKRPMDALKAFSIASQGAPQARMVVAGTGDMEPECREYVERAGLGERVCFLGYRTDVADLMRAADIYILPTAGESFGVTLVEAMAAGAALLTTRIAPIAGEVVPENCALFAPLGDVEEFARAMSRCLHSPELRRTLGENARKAARERYALNVCAERHIALYSAIAGRRAKRGLLPSRRLAAAAQGTEN